MTAKTYEKISAPFRKHPKSVKRMETMNRILTAVTYVAYIVLVVSQLVLMINSFTSSGVKAESKFWSVLLVPAVGFLAVTLFRKVCNAKRPYQVLEIEPLLSRRKEGQSFPSRHAFSIFMIAMALAYVWLPVGIVFLVLGVLLAAVRVIGGVHFPRDVIAGAIIAILWGLVGFSISMSHAVSFWVKP